MHGCIINLKKKNEINSLEKIYITQINYKIIETKSPVFNHTSIIYVFIMLSQYKMERTVEKKFKNNTGTILVFGYYILSR